MATIAFKSGAFAGSVDIGQGEAIHFTAGSATVTQLDERAATLPRGGRLRRIVQYLNNRFGSGTFTIDGVEPDSYFRTNFGYEMPEHR
jgi:hypothetical protein